LKKVLFVFVAAVLFVVGCNSQAEETANEEVELTVHTNIDDDIARDSYQIMRKIEKAIEEDEKPDTDVLLDYSDKYLTGYNDGDIDLTEEEVELVLITSLMVVKLDEYFTIGSERRDFEKDKETFYKTMKTGEYDKGGDNNK
jgi:hypothetical protein